MRFKLFYFSSETFPYIIKFCTKLDLTKFPYYYLANCIFLTWFVYICNIFRAKHNFLWSFYFSKFQRNKDRSQNLIWILEIQFFLDQEKKVIVYNLNPTQTILFNFKKFWSRKVWFRKCTLKFILVFRQNCWPFDKNRTHFFQIEIWFLFNKEILLF